MAGTYTDTYGLQYDPTNPYSYGQAGFKEPTYNFQPPSNNSSSGQTLSNLIGNSGEGIANQQAYESLPESYKFILRKKWGLWDGTDQDTGTKGIADTLDDINKIVVYKGGSPVSDWSQVPSALDPIIKKRNAKVGLGGILKVAAPIALSLLAPGIGTALGITSMAGTTALGAGLGALGGGIAGGAKGALLGAVGGGFSGAFSGAGGLSGLNNSLGYAAEGANFVGPVQGPLSGLVSGASKLGSSVNLTKIAGALQDASGQLSGGQTQQQSSGGYDQAQLEALIKQIMAQNGTGQRKSAFLQAAGLAQGGMVRGPGDGMSDGVPAVIGGGAPAALSDGEHVVPALQVAMLGRGSGKAGSSKIEQLVKREIAKMYGDGANPVALQKQAMKKGNK